MTNAPSEIPAARRSLLCGCSVDPAVRLHFRVFRNYRLRNQVEGLGERTIPGILAEHKIVVLPNCCRLRRCAALAISCLASALAPGGGAYGRNLLRRTLGLFLALVALAAVEHRASVRRDCLAGVVADNRAVLLRSVVATRLAHGMPHADTAFLLVEFRNTTAPFTIATR